MSRCDRSCADDSMPRSAWRTPLSRIKSFGFLPMLELLPAGKVRQAAHQADLLEHVDRRPQFLSFSERTARFVKLSAILVRKPAQDIAERERSLDAPLSIIATEERL